MRTYITVIQGILFYLTLDGRNTADEGLKQQPINQSIEHPFRRGARSLALSTTSNRLVHMLNFIG